MLRAWLWFKYVVSVILRMRVTNNPPGWNYLSLFKPPHLTSPFTPVTAAETVNVCHIKLLAHTMFTVYLFCRGRDSGEKVKKRETIKPRPSSQSRGRKCSFLCYSLSRHLLTSKSPTQCLLGAGFWELRAPSGQADTNRTNLRICGWWYRILMFGFALPASWQIVQTHLSINKCKKWSLIQVKMMFRDYRLNCNILCMKGNDPDLQALLPPC